MIGLLERSKAVRIFAVVLILLLGVIVIQLWQGINLVVSFQDTLIIVFSLYFILWPFINGREMEVGYRLLPKGIDLIFQFCNVIVACFLIIYCVFSI